MITPDVALARLLALAKPVVVETVPLNMAAGRWTADAVVARRTQPACDQSAMDGFAIAHVEMSGARWEIVGESAAGSPFKGTVHAGQAVRISTGANMPEGTDTVLIQEATIWSGNVLTLGSSGPVGAGEHVRRRGSDFSAGLPLIAAGERLTPARIALAAIDGRRTLTVRRRIRIAIVSTGDELLSPDTAPDPHRLPSSNAVMLEAIVADYPVDVTDLGIVGDQREALRDTFVKAADHDVLVTTGGASVGDHDLVRPALLDAGATIDFWRIGMRPGKPLMAGRLGNTVALGLPGNPVSAFVTAILFLKPLIARLAGAADPRPRAISARLAAPMPQVGARADFVRGRWQDGDVAPLDGNSGMLLPLAAAEVLIIRDVGASAAAAGTIVQVIPIA